MRGVVPAPVENDVGAEDCVSNVVEVTLGGGTLGQITVEVAPAGILLFRMSKLTCTHRYIHTCLPRPAHVLFLSVSRNHPRLANVLFVHMYVYMRIEVPPLRDT